MSALNNLDELNALRALNGKAPLKSWKESKDKLLIAITKEESEAVSPVVAKNIKTTTNIVDSMIEENKKANSKIARVKPIKPAEIAALADHNKQQMKKADLKPATKKIAEKVAQAKKRVQSKRDAQAGLKKPAIVKGDNHNTGVVNVAAIAKELGVNAKVARATIRRKKVDRTDEAAIRAALKK